MKYRVKQIGNWYYPQYKWLCFWIDIKENKTGMYGDYIYTTTAKRASLDSAKYVIVKYKKSLPEKERIVNIWEIE